MYYYVILSPLIEEVKRDLPRIFRIDTISKIFTLPSFRLSLGYFLESGCTARVGGKFQVLMYFQCLNQIVLISMDTTAHSPKQTNKRKLRFYSAPLKYTNPFIRS